MRGNRYSVPASLAGRPVRVRLTLDGAVAVYDGEQCVAQHRLVALSRLLADALTRDEASLYFRLLVRRYERASLIVTSNKSFVDWGEVFNDQILATAILDRLLHHATTVNIKGDSYRLREEKKAGLLGRKPQPADAPGDLQEVGAEA